MVRQDGEVRELCSDPEGYVVQELNEEGLRVSFRVCARASG